MGVHVFFSIAMMCLAILRIGIDAWDYIRATQWGSEVDVTFNNRGIGGIGVSFILIVFFGVLNWRERHK